MDNAKFDLFSLFQRNLILQVFVEVGGHGCGFICLFIYLFAISMITLNCSW